MPLEFQITYLYPDNIILEDDSDSESDDDTSKKSFPIKKFILNIYGRTADSKSVHCIIKNYKPYFYIEIPSTWKSNHIELYINKVKSELKKYHSKAFINYETVQKHKFYGFHLDETNGNIKKFNFIKVYFHNIMAFKAFLNIVKKGIKILQIQPIPINLRVYESDLEPMIRLIHDQELKACDWVIIKHYNSYESYNFNVDTSVIVDYKYIKHLQKSNFSPMKILSWDIEAKSSHGDMPLANKDYKKLSMDIMNNYTGNLYKFYRKEISTCITNIPSYISNCLNSAFSLEENMYNTNLVYINKRDTSNNEKIKNIHEIIHTINPDIEKILKIFNEKNLTDAKTKSSALDQINDILTTNLPSLEGDIIIQIGANYRRLTDDYTYHKEIFVLGECDPIKDVNVVSCNTEKEVIIKFIDSIISHSPDVITGYNTFGFDDNFIYFRSKELGIEHHFQKITRNKDIKCEYKEKELKSSALGENILKMMVINGIVNFDLFKVIQREQKLDAYNLDFVSSVFIKGKVIYDSIKYYYKSKDKIIEYDKLKSKKKIGVCAF